MQRTRGFRGAAAALGLAVLSAVLVLPARLSAADNVDPRGAGAEEAVQVVAAVLQLTPEQVGAWVAILAVEREALRPLQEQIQLRRQAIAAMLASGNPQPPLVGQLLIEIHALEGQASVIQAQAVAQFRQLLAPPQNLKLEQIRRAAPVCSVVPAFAAVGLIPHDQ
jgi:Spy/CpxP family protein refolding chaperone